MQLHQENAVSLPPVDAVAEILPDKQMLLYEKAAAPVDSDLDDADMLSRYGEQRPSLGSKSLLLW